MNFSVTSSGSRAFFSKISIFISTIIGSTLALRVQLIAPLVLFPFILLRKEKWLRNQVTLLFPGIGTAKPPLNWYFPG